MSASPPSSGGGAVGGSKELPTTASSSSSPSSTTTTTTSSSTTTTSTTTPPKVELLRVSNKKARIKKLMIEYLSGGEIDDAILNFKKYYDMVAQEMDYTNSTELRRYCRRSVMESNDDDDDDDGLDYLTMKKQIQTEVSKLKKIECSIKGAMVSYLTGHNIDDVLLHFKKYANQIAKKCKDSTPTTVKTLRLISQTSSTLKERIQSEVSKFVDSHYLNNTTSSTSTTTTSTRRRNQKKKKRRKIRQMIRRREHTQALYFCRPSSAFIKPPPKEEEDDDDDVDVGGDDDGSKNDDTNEEESSEVTSETIDDPAAAAAADDDDTTTIEARTNRAESGSNLGEEEDASGDEDEDDCANASNRFGYYYDWVPDGRSPIKITKLEPPKPEGEDVEASARASPMKKSRSKQEPPPPKKSTPATSSESAPKKNSRKKKAPPPNLKNSDATIDADSFANSASSPQKNSTKKPPLPKSYTTVAAGSDNPISAETSNPIVALDAVSVIKRRISHEEYEYWRSTAGDDRQPYNYLLSALKDPSNHIFMAEVGIECIGILIYRLEHARIKQGFKHQDATAVLLWVKPTHRRMGLTTLLFRAGVTHLIEDCKIDHGYFWSGRSVSPNAIKVVEGQRWKRTCKANDATNDNMYYIELHDHKKRLDEKYEERVMKNRLKKERDEEERRQKELILLAHEEGEDDDDRKPKASSKQDGDDDDRKPEAAAASRTGAATQEDDEAKSPSPKADGLAATNSPALSTISVAAVAVALAKSSTPIGTSTPTTTMMNNASCAAESEAVKVADSNSGLKNDDVETTGTTTSFTTKKMPAGLPVAAAKSRTTNTTPKVMDTTSTTAVAKAAVSVGHKPNNDITTRYTNNNVAGTVERACTSTATTAGTGMAAVPTMTATVPCLQSKGLQQESDSSSSPSLSSKTAEKAVAPYKTSTAAGFKVKSRSKDEAALSPLLKEKAASTKKGHQADKKEMGMEDGADDDDDHAKKRKSESSSEEASLANTEAAEATAMANAKPSSVSTKSVSSLVDTTKDDEELEPKQPTMGYCVDKVKDVVLGTTRVAKLFKSESKRMQELIFGTVTKKHEKKKDRKRLIYWTIKYDDDVKEDENLDRKRLLEALKLYKSKEKSDKRKYNNCKQKKKAGETSSSAAVSSKVAPISAGAGASHSPHVLPQEDSLSSNAAGKGTEPNKVPLRFRLPKKVPSRKIDTNGVVDIRSDDDPIQRAKNSKDSVQNKRTVPSPPETSSPSRAGAEDVASPLPKKTRKVTEEATASQPRNEIGAKIMEDISDNDHDDDNGRWGRAYLDRFDRARAANRKDRTFSQSRGGRNIVKPAIYPIPDTNLIPNGKRKASDTTDKISSKVTASTKKAKPNNTKSKEATSRNLPAPSLTVADCASNKRKREEGDRYVRVGSQHGSQVLEVGFSDEASVIGNPNTNDMQNGNTNVEVDRGPPRQPVRKRGMTLRRVWFRLCERDVDYVELHCTALYICELKIAIYKKHCEGLLKGKTPLSVRVFAKSDSTSCLRNFDEIAMKAREETDPFHVSFI